MPESQRRLTAFLSRPGVVEGICILLGLAALQPLLAPGYMWGHDTGAHIFRLVEVSRALADGVFYPRFLPDAYGGLGGPILDFNPVAPYYFPALLVLAGLGPIVALKIAAGAYLLCGGIAMRILARPHLGRIGAAVAGLAWIYFPYRIANIYVRMAFSELAVMALLPLAMAAARRAARRPSAARTAVAALLMGAIPAVHFPGSVLGLPLVVVYAIFFAGRGRRVRAMAVVAACAVLALGFSAFSWLPALADIEGTHYMQSTAGYDNYQNHFVDPVQLVSTRWGFGSSMPGATDTMSFQIGWAHLLVLALVLLAALRLPSIRPLAIFCGFVTAAGVFLMLGVSRPLWAALPPLQNVQFPWRNLMVVGVATSLSAGLASILPAAVLAGGEGAGRRPKAGRQGSGGGERGEGPRGRLPGVPRADALLASRPAGRIVPVVVIALLCGACLPYLQSRRGKGSDADFTPDAIREKYFGELKFQPIEVSRPRFRPAGPRAALAGEGTAKIVQEATHRMVVDVSVPAPTTLRLHLFASPGWHARFRGRDLPVRVEPGTGLLLVDLPAGAGDLDLRFGNTPSRLAAWILSGLCLAVSLALILRRRFPRRRAA